MNRVRSANRRKRQAAQMVQASKRSGFRNKNGKSRRPKGKIHPKKLNFLLNLRRRK